MLLNKAEQNDTERSINWQRLQDLCLRRGWDLGQLAKEAGVSRTTLYHWQTQKTIRPRLSTVFKLAAALQVQPRDLTDAADEEPAEEAGITASSVALWPGLQRPSAAFDRQTNPYVDELSGRQPELFADWTSHDWDELFSTFGVGGELNEQGVREQVAAINERKTVLYELQVVLETHLADAARRIVHSLYESVQAGDGEGPG